MLYIRRHVLIIFACPVSLILNWLHSWQRIKGSHRFITIILLSLQNIHCIQLHPYWNFGDLINTFADCLSRNQDWNILPNSKKKECSVFHISVISDNDQQTMIFDLIIDFRMFFSTLLSIQHRRSQCTFLQIWFRSLKCWVFLRICHAAEKNYFLSYRHALVAFI